MPLEQTVRNAHMSLLQLRDALVDVRLTVVEDKPQAGDLVLVDVLGDRLDALQGWVEQALAAADGARLAAVQPANLNQLQRWLVTCQEQYHVYLQHFTVDLASYERITELNRAARRGGEWRAWAQSVRKGIDETQHHTTAVGQALFVCWQEVGERIGGTSISVTASSVGQSVVQPGQEV